MPSSAKRQSPHSAKVNTRAGIRSLGRAVSDNAVRGKPTAPKLMARSKNSGFNPTLFLTSTGLGKTVIHPSKGEAVFSQGDVANSVFHIKEGRVKISVVSKRGKEAVIALLGPGEFIGEECIATGHPLRLTTATCLTDCVFLKIGKKEMARVLRQEHSLSDVFVSFLLERNARIQADLVDQLFNSSEKRLARVLLLLAQFGKKGTPELTLVPKLSQETLAEMIGTTRSRVSFFMNRFRKMGFIEYNGEMRIHSSLLNIILHD